MAALSTLVALVLAAQAPAPIQDAPRLRTILKSGAISLIERIPNADRCSVQLWATGRECRETPETHGRRHLLEHLVAKGKNRDLDRRLEMRGMYLTAQTFRDAMKFEINCAAKDVAFATRALREIMDPMEFTADEIAKEARVIEQELALVPPEQHLAAAAWRQAYEDRGLDPLGTAFSIKETTPADLKDLHARQFDRRGLVMVIAGPVSLAEASVFAADALGETPGPKKPAEEPRPVGQSGEAKAEAPGEARAAIVPGLGESRAIWVLTAGMALASHAEVGILYTPSAQPGLVVLTSPESGRLVRAIDEITDAEALALFPIGMALMESWLGQASDPAAVASLRGALLAQRVDLKPEGLLEVLRRMTPENFMEGFAAFKVGKAVVVEGQAPSSSLAKGRDGEGNAYDSPSSLAARRSSPSLREGEQPAPAAERLKLVEVPIPTADLVVLQAIVPAAGLSGKDRAALAILGEALLDGTQEYTRNQFYQYGSTAGFPPLVEVLPDHLRIQIVLPKDGLGVACGLMESIVRRPSLRDEDVLRRLRRRTSVTPSIWAQALDPTQPDFSRVKPADVRELHLRLFRPEHVQFAVGGGFGAGAGEKALRTAFEGWQPKRVPKPAPDPPARPLWLRRPLVATFELRTDPIKLTDSRLPAMLLAAFALGVGKDGSMHRVLRDGNAWTYRQEAILWPTLQGWQIRLVFAQASADGQQGLPEAARKALYADMSTWTGDSRTRALAMAEASLSRNLEVSPFWSGPSGPLPAGSVGATYWVAYSALLGQPTFSQAGLLEAIRSVTLDELKGAAGEMLTEAKVLIVYGGKLPEAPAEGGDSARSGNR